MQHGQTFFDVPGVGLYAQNRESLVELLLESEEEKSESLFAYLSVDARTKYKNKFIDGWSLNESGRDFPSVCDWLVEEYAKEVEPDELIRTAIEARLDFDNLLGSLVQLCDMYVKAGFNEHAKYSMLCRAAMLNSRLANFMLIKGPTDFQDMNQAIVQLVKNSETFKTSSDGANGKQLQTWDPELFLKRPANVGSVPIDTLRDDMKGLEMRFDNRLDLLTYQLESLTLTIKKKQTDKQKLADQRCSY